MRHTLLKSIISLALFYWVGGMFFFLFLGPDKSIELLNSMPKIIRPPEVPEVGSVVFWKVTGLHLQILETWTLTMVKIWAIFCLIGALFAFALSRMRFMKRAARIKQSGSFRGMTITIGKMFFEPPPKLVPTAFKLKGIKITERESALLSDILGVLKANPHAYAGVGHGSHTLYEHTLGVMKRVIRHRSCNGEMLIAAAAHDMGKITSFKKNDRGEWVRIKMHAQESARLMGTLESWYQLPEESRERIRMAVKYEHCPNDLPGIDPTIKAPDLDPLLDYRSRRDSQHKIYDKPGFRSSVLALIEALREADGLQTAAEKKKVLETIEDLPEFCYQAFIKALPELPFYEKGVPRGFQAMGWKNGHRYFLSEAKMREYIMDRSLSPEHQAALGGNYRGPKTIAPFTWNLLQALDKKGMLVKEGPCWERLPKKDEEVPPPVDKKLRDDMPLWDIISGAQVLNGIIVIDAHPSRHTDFIDKAGKGNVPFKIVLHAPHQERLAYKAAKKQEKEIRALQDKADMGKAIHEDSADIKSAAEIEKEAKEAEEKAINALMAIDTKSKKVTKIKGLGNKLKEGSAEKSKQVSEKAVSAEDDDKAWAPPENSGSESVPALSRTSEPLKVEDDFPPDPPSNRGAQIPDDLPPDEPMPETKPESPQVPKTPPQRPNKERPKEQQRQDRSNEQNAAPGIRSSKKKSGGKKPGRVLDNDLFN